MPDNFVDFRDIKQRVSMEQIMGRYDIKLRRSNQVSFRGHCPLPTHTSDKSTESFSVQTEKNIWACQSASCASARQGKRGGNILDFVSLMEKCSIRDAGLKLHEWFLSAPPTEKIPTEKNAPTEKLVAEKNIGTTGGEVNKLLSFTLKDVDSMRIPGHVNNYSGVM